ncbi:hypothetical protein E4U43_002420 [Claviceps pusilla]|uniref:Uncharacterized protein n=1 Tax=Claviceps pusilla TaxID=123648 RepID=A0A9P7N8D3_9HYPO|nr:hypothetical protein E4U43_002420 [Claviceps pusilla]
MPLVCCRSRLTPKVRLVVAVQAWLRMEDTQLGAGAVRNALLARTPSEVVETIVLAGAERARRKDVMTALSRSQEARSWTIEYGAQIAGMSSWSLG